MSQPLSAEQLLAVLALLASGEARDADDVRSAAGENQGDRGAVLAQLAAHGVRRLADGRLQLPGGADLLDADEIMALRRSSDPAPVQVLGVTGSTHDAARALIEAGADGVLPRALLAEAQVSGRGRRGRHWASPVASNLYLTQIEPLAAGPESAQGLPLAIGVTLAQVVEDAVGADVSLKWPNDVLVGARKLAGILVELVVTGRSTHALVGIGLNVRVPDYVARTIDQPWVDLAALGGELPSRNALAARLVDEVHATLARFREVGFDAVERARWHRLDAFHDAPVEVRRGDDVFTGVERGVDASGRLRIETAGEIVLLDSGETSLRRLAPDAIAGPPSGTGA